MVAGSGANHSCRLAIFSHNSSSGWAVVEGSQFFAWVFCPDFFPIFALAGPGASFQDSFSAIALGITHSYLRCSCSDVGRTGGGAFFVESVVTISHRWPDYFFSGLEFLLRRAIPLGFLAVDDSSSSDHIQPDHFSAANSRFQGCSGRTAAGGCAGVARRKHY